MADQLKKTIREVENERTKLDALFLHMTDGVVAFNRNGAVIHANPAAEEMLSRPIPIEGEVDYNQLFGSITPLGELLGTKEDCLEADMRQGERSLHLLFASFSREEQAGLLVVIHDVTQQMKTEELRREFVANVSHELRTPLTNIRSYAETLSDTEDLPKDMQQNFLQVILNESDRMTHIVQDLLTLSRFDSSRGDMNFSWFPFEAALRDLYEAVRLEAQRRGHQLELIKQDPLPKIRADRERILQVMMNIVSNSIKYTPNGGRIIISAGVMQNGVWIEVSDNGIGIPPEDQERIFERFYRVDKARSRESGGTGLGLSIAKEIVDRHEGTICLVNREEAGTTVRLELKTEGPEHE
jgi:two-component system sensor histidine kinase VicK